MVDGCGLAVDAEVEGVEPALRKLARRMGDLRLWEDQEKLGHPPIHSIVRGKNRGKVRHPAIIQFDNVWNRIFR